MFIYLASPYTHESEAVRQERFLAAEAFTAHHIAQGVTVFSPIVHYHEMAKKFSLPVEFDFWERHNMNMLDRAAELWILTLPGWEISKGVACERFHAARARIPISFKDPI